MKYSLVAVFLAAALSLTAPAQKITSFSVPGAVSTVPVSINATGVIAGEYFDSQFFVHGFVRSTKGVVTAFDAFGSTAQQTTVQGINSSGTIVGSFDHCLSPSCRTGAVYYIYLRSAIAKFTQLTLCDPTTIPSPVGINDSGEIAGGCGNGLGFTWQNGVETNFAVPGDNVSTVPTAINNSGEIAGRWSNTTGVRAQGFFRDAFGNITTFSVPNSSETWPYSINSSGEISGWYLDNANNESPFIRHADGSFTVFSVAGNVFFEFPPPVLNDSGTVVGGAAPFNGSPQTEGYIRSTNGAIRQFQVLGSVTAVSTINNLGHVAGFYTADGVTNGFVF